MAEEYEKVDHPKHYNQSPARCTKCGHPIECIDVIEHMSLNIGTAVKYLWRAGLKPGEDFIHDFKKATWYISREILKIGKERVQSAPALKVELNGGDPARLKKALEEATAKATEKGFQP